MKKGLAAASYDDIIITINMLMPVNQSLFDQLGLQPKLDTCIGASYVRLAK